MRYAEHILASAIGAASSRLVLSLLLRKRTVSTKAALKLLDDANAAIQYNREILQTALDHVRQGIAVFDKDLELICWNRQFGDILDLPPSLIRTGIGLAEILRFNGRRSEVGAGRIDEFVHKQLARYIEGHEPFLERFAEGMVIEVRANRMPDGGIVTTFTDITASVEAAEALERANETLERRVHERTEELTRLNAALARAKGEADAANISKTKFLAAASHDILQPLNAARLYVTSLIERRRGHEDSRLIDNVDASLEAVEEIIGALHRYFAARHRRHAPGIRQLPHRRIAAPDRAGIRAARARQGPRAYLHALIGGGARRPAAAAPAGAEPRLQRHQIHAGGPRAGRLPAARRRTLRIDVYDTGVGIPQSKQRDIFMEFHRLDEGAKIARGLGLGLSIVERIARVLGGDVEVVSERRPRLAFRRHRAALERRADRTAGARRAARSTRPAHRHRRALHRQRALGARRHGNACCRAGAAR